MQVEKLAASCLDQERILLLANSSLPESGVFLKQLNAEIYECKVDIEQKERDEDLLLDKITSLKNILESETGDC